MPVPITGLICYTLISGIWLSWVVTHSLLREGVMRMSVFESLVLMIAFAMFVIAVLSEAKK